MIGLTNESFVEEVTGSNLIIMFASTVHLAPVLCLLFSVSATATGNSPPYIPTQVILLSCGDSTNTTSADGRKWVGDAHSKFISSSNFATTKSFVAEASRQDQSVTLVPYMTARIFRSNFTYTFPVTPGPKFLRLYFYPESYSGLDITTSFFSVSANTYTLLNNFSAFLTCSAIYPPVASFIKEFVIRVSDDQVLNVTFTPSPMSFAFINGIEVVSMPDNLYAGVESLNRKEPIFVNTGSIFSFDKYSALETAYRLNVGGATIPGTHDTGMFREWRNDIDYIYGSAFGVTSYMPNGTINFTNDTPAYIAPVSVYTTSRTMGPYPSINKNYNLTWIFPLDPGFIYLFRLHFCETKLELVNQRVFSIFINNQTAIEDADVVGWAGDSGIPVYRDYAVQVSIENSSKRDVWLELHPLLDSLPMCYDAILNGVEILKLNNSNGNLAGKNPELPKVAPGSLEPKRSTKNKLSVVTINAAVLGSVLAFSLLCLAVFKVSYGSLFSRKTLGKVNISPQPQPLDNLCTHFSLSEIKAATNNFDDVLIIGVGGFGNVYKGSFVNDEDFSFVAIKRLNPESQQGTLEFKTEIEMLSRLRHKHLVSLIGYCDEDGEMILVYDYMARGTLRDHLYNSDNPPLPWIQRLKICIGAARGLHYLHTGSKHVIIHRDVKTTNILLDEKWVAKVSDFGLSKLGPLTASQSHVTTEVKGTWGYLDPDYFLLERLTEKSDVYSFGIVLFEVLCARPPLLETEDVNQASLAFWVQDCYDNGTFDQIVDPFLKGKIAPECLNKFVEVARRCLYKDRGRRPLMSEVASSLEFALRLQNSAEKGGLVIETPIATHCHEKGKMPLERHTADYSASGSRVW